MEAWAGQPWRDEDPWGDPAAHQDLAALEAGLVALPDPPRGCGRVLGVVLRLVDQQRLTPPRVHLCPEQGVVGDRWALGKRRPEMQVAIMRADVAQLIANGQHGALFGNNLLVDLDLAEDQVPAGTRLRVGTALCKVSEELHTPCSQFSRRFGPAAFKLTLDKRWLDQHLRGIFLTILEAGDVAPGDGIEVLG